MKRLQAGAYDWRDLRRLVRQSEKLDAAEIIKHCTKAYSFLSDFTEKERDLALDAPAHRQTILHRSLALSCRKMKAKIPIHGFTRE